MVLRSDLAYYFSPAALGVIPLFSGLFVGDGIRQEKCDASLTSLLNNASIETIQAIAADGKPISTHDFSTFFGVNNSYGCFVEFDEILNPLVFVKGV